MTAERDAILDRLGQARAASEGVTLRKLFADDPQRFDQFSVRLDDMLYDFSKTHVTPEILSQLVDLARACDVEGRRDAMFSGEKINTTEDRAVLHTALRAPAGAKILVDGKDVMPEVLAERAKAADFADAVRSGELLGATGERFTDIVNIGIGGSDLGPAMAAQALSPYAQEGLAGHFVSNVDGAHIADTLAGLDPARTLILVASKTFTTLETMSNAQAARAWLVEALGEDAVAAHFAAISTNAEAVSAFGMDTDRMFQFWDWVGGRYSLWSVIGLSVEILIGPDNFQAFLDGAAEVDLHFQTTPLAENIPALMGLIGVWHRNVCGYATHAVLPYDQRLARFPAYLQQLDMESNGKSVTRDGAPATLATGPVVWGEPGTNGQHAFYQLLHQGVNVVPADILMAAIPHETVGDQHAMLLANALAQGEAFMRGRTTEEATEQLTKAGKSADAAAALAPHKTFPGDRPTCAIAYRTLNPRTLGRLIALYEHKVFVQGTIWGINSFDQWGVELGKELASRLIPVVKGEAGADGLDGSTAGLVTHLARLRGEAMSAGEGNQLRRSAVDTPAGPLNVLKGGRGAETVMLIHGNSSCGLVFEPLAMRLVEAGFRVLVVDLPGHGASADAHDPEATYSFRGYAAALAGVIDSLRPDILHVMGWSLGGHVALELAARDPRIRSVLVTGAPPITPGQPSMSGAFRGTATTALTFKEHWEPGDAERYTAATLGENVPATPELLEAAIRTDGRARTNLYAACQTSEDADEVALIRDDPRPIAIVQGKRDPFLDLDYLRALPADRLWRGAIQWMPDSGHAPHWDAPEDFASVALAFLRQTRA